MTANQKTSPIKAWFLAIRPKTLPAAISPVIVGTAAAIADKEFVFVPALAALGGALLLQVGVNLANDYFDFKKGIDTTDRLGPVRVTQSGLIAPGAVASGMILILALAAVIGVYLITIAGWPILVIGLASLVSALAYSGGPYPLASHGLGDVFVFTFFGIVAVCGTYFVQALQFSWVVLLYSVPVGLLITAILVINNLRDMDTDRKAGKNTLAVILGGRGAKIEYACLILIAYLFPLVFWVSGMIGLWGLLPLVSLPQFLRLILFVNRSEGYLLNQALSRTAILTAIFCILMSLGLVL